MRIEDKFIGFRVRISSPAMHSKRRMQEACEFAIESNLISIIETNLDNYHERKTGEAFTIKLSDPYLNRQ